MKVTSCRICGDLLPCACEGAKVDRSTAPNVRCNGRENCLNAAMVRYKQRNLCFECREDVATVEAKAYTESLGLTTREQQWRYVRKTIKGILERQPKPSRQREPGDDDEELRA